MRWLLFLVSTILLASDEDKSVSITITSGSLIPSKAIDSIPLAASTEDDMAQTALICFFKGNGAVVQERLRPYVKRHLEREVRHSVKESLAKLNMQRLSLDDSDSIEPDAELQKYISDLLGDALDEALQDREREAARYHFQASSRLTKAKAAVIVAGCSLLSAALAAGVTLAIHFSECDDSE